MDLRTAEAIVEREPALAAVTRIEPLDAGYSSDTKFVLYVNASPAFVLRIAPIAHEARRRRDFVALGELRARAVRSSEPIALGQAEGGALVYTVLSYVVGTDGEVALPEMTEAACYEAGVEGGGELRKVHAAPAPRLSNWAAERRTKYETRSAAVRERGLGFAGETEAEAFVRGNLHLLDEAAIVFQHDDFHPANVILRDAQFVALIDFNRSDYGDPYEDFRKLPWFTLPVSAAFARGCLVGYFEAYEPPRDFWPRYTLHVAMSGWDSVLWAADSFPAQLADFRERSTAILAGHDLVDGGPPAWWLAR